MECGIGALFDRSIQVNITRLVSFLKQNRASVRLKSGRRLELLLDQEIVEDPEEVLATDQRGRAWALSVGGLDEPSNGSETFAVADSLVNSRGFLLRALRRSIVAPS